METMLAPMAVVERTSLATEKVRWNSLLSRVPSVPVSFELHDDRAPTVSPLHQMKKPARTLHPRPFKLTPLEIIQLADKKARTIARAPGYNRQRLTTFLMEPHGMMPNMALSRLEVEHIVAYIETLK